MSTILILATVQAFFLSALTIAKKNKLFADKVLALWLVLLGLHLLVNIIYAELIFQNFIVLNLSAGFPYLQGPLLYIYVRSLALQQARMKASDSLHFVPFALYVVYQWLVLNSYSHSPTSEHINVHFFAQSIYFNILLLASVPLYIMLSIKLLMRYQKIISNNFSSLEKINLNWLKYLLFGLAVVWLVVIIEFILYEAGQQSHTIFISITLFLYAVGYLGLTQTTVFSNLFIYNEKIVTINSTGNQEQENTHKKYKNSGLSKDQAQLKKNELLEYMQNFKPFLDEQITLFKLATQLDMSSHHLSQLINDQCQQNFFDFINGYRIEEVKRRLKSLEFDDQSLLVIAFDAGFASKSSFNRLFKKSTGLTPSQFRKDKN
jgi:AraC-like DNA-binding protein